MRLLRSARGCALLATGIAATLANRVAWGTEPTQNSQPAAYQAIARPDAKLGFDWAKLRARARVVYVNSGPMMLADRMIDDDLRTVFRFPGSDRQVIVIVELAQSQQLHRVSAVFKAEATRFDIYLLNELPKQPADLQQMKPFMSVVDPQPERGAASVDFSPSSARYVALRWIRSKSREPFEVAEISALSSNPVSDQDPQLAAETGPNFGAPDPPRVPTVSP